MQEKVTLKQIAERTGVSLVTVHRAIYGKSGISEKTRQKILKEVKRSNYQVDAAASALKRQSRNVYVVLPKPQNEECFYFRVLWREVRKAAKEMEQYKLYFHEIESEYSLTEMSRELERVYDSELDQMDGLITVADSEAANIWISRFAKRGVPVSLLSSYYIGNQDLVTCIRGDHVRCARLAAEFMGYSLKKDGGKVLLLRGDRQIYSNYNYEMKFEQCIKSMGYELLYVDGSDRQEMEKISLGYLNSGDKIQGIFAGNARNTYNICRIIEENQISRDIVVVGTDVFEELEPYYENGILNATICQYQWEQATYAVKIIYDALIYGISGQEELELPPVLIMRSNYDCFL